VPFIWVSMLILGRLLMGLPVHAGQDRLVVYTVNYPLQYFAQRIAGDRAKVVFPAPPNVDPAFWQPDAQTVVAYQGADLILLNGAGYAQWIDRVTLPRRRLVNTSAGFRERYLRVDDAITHSHGPAREHSHSGTAFTTWLDFSLAAEQARSISKALTSLRPGLSSHSARKIETERYFIAANRHKFSIVPLTGWSIPSAA